MMTRVRSAVVNMAGVMLLASCASINVDSLPQLGGSDGDGYPVTIEFSSVLNLPDRAKIVQDGKTVGVVTRINLKTDHVDVESRIDNDVVIPADTRATLQQSTVLGDTYVALEEPSDTPDPTRKSAPLVPGGRIPVANTTSPPQLEDTIANLANFVGSGSIQRIQNSIIGVNKVTPARRDELARMVSRVTVDLGDLSNNIDVVDTMLNGVSGTANVMNRHLSTYAYWFSPAGMVGFDRATQAAGYIGTVLPSIGSIYSGGYWLVPMLNSLADATGAVQQTKWNVEGEAPHWRDLFLNDFLPVDKNPAINITSIKGPDGREMVGNVQDVLRILGATP